MTVSKPVDRPDKKLGPRTRCVHCLAELDSETKDHVFPTSWYPDSTPADVQRWTVPSCAACNGTLGKLEKELFVRLALCVDPRKAEASGMSKKALRSLGIGVADDLEEKEKKHREALLRKVFAEVKPLRDQKLPLLPGVGLHDGFPAGDQLTIVFPTGPLEPVSQKIVRGCEFKLNSEAYVEPPLTVKTYFIHDKGAEDLTAFLDKLPATRVGPGFLVARGQAPPEEGVHMVLYRIAIWGTWKIYASIDADQH